MRSHAGSVVLITGGAGGIGSAAAEYFLEREASVCISDKDPQRLGRVEAGLSRFGERLLAIQETVATPEGAQRIVEETAACFGSLDVLINNAALVRDHLLLSMPVDAFDEVVDTNLKGVFYCTKAAVPHMAANGRGRIINLIAASGFSGNPGQTNYAAAKGGVAAMTLTWSVELLRRGITANAVIPAAWTAMSESIPQDVLLKVAGEETVRKMRRRNPAQVAPLFGFLASDEAAGVTGQCFCIAGQSLSVWGYARPVVETESENDIFEEEEIGRFWRSRDDLRQVPSPAIF